MSFDCITQKSYINYKHKHPKGLSVHFHEHISTLNFNTPKTSPTKLFNTQTQKRSLNSSGLNEQSNLVDFFFYIFYILHWYFQRNDKANCSRTVLAFCFIGTSTVSYWWLISDVSSPFLSQTRYCGEDVGSSLRQIHSFSLHEVIWIIAILQKRNHIKS